MYFNYLAMRKLERNCEPHQFYVIKTVFDMRNIGKKPDKAVLHKH